MRSPESKRRLKIAILGTRGVPNQYGGFEQFAEFLSVRLAKRGHDVIVYNPHHHSYSGHEFKSVKILRMPDPVKWLGSASQIIYDYLCLKDSVRRNVDIALELGYQSSAPSYLLLNLKKIKIITNMDGMEWKREKWNILVKRLTKYFEKVAVRRSDQLVVDSIGIQNYFISEYNIHPRYIPYGAVIVEKFDHEHVKKYGLNPDQYFLLIARIEPENNIEMIIKGFLQSESKFPLVIIGNYQTSYGKKIHEKYSNERIIYPGPVYQKKDLDSIRHYSRMYFHGHSIGGTNPSLLEAMSAGCLISAHDNEYNRYVLCDEGFYFSNANDINAIISDNDCFSKKSQYVSSNLEKINREYHWDKITDDYENLILQTSRQL